MRESISSDRPTPDRRGGVHHISEIVPLVLARIGVAEPQSTTESDTSAEPPYAHVDVPNVLVEA
jgi:hypothetical protein